MMEGILMETISTRECSKMMSYYSDDLNTGTVLGKWNRSKCTNYCGTNACHCGMNLSEYTYRVWSEQLHA